MRWLRIFNIAATLVCCVRFATGQHLALVQRR
jgi:hypothetical protein